MRLFIAKKVYFKNSQNVYIFISAVLFDFIQFKNAQIPHNQMQGRITVLVLLIYIAILWQSAYVFIVCCLFIIEQ
jgi:hypothetical protein